MIKEFRNAIATTLQAEISDLATVDVHGGRFDLGELQRYAKLAPACVVAVHRVEGQEQGGGSVANVLITCTVFAQRKAGRTQHDIALDIVEEVIKQVTGGTNQRWGLDGVGRPTTPRADNLYVSDIDKQGVAMWVLGWSQLVDLETVADGLDDFIVFAADWDLAETDGAYEASDVLRIPSEAMYASGQLTLDAPVAQTLVAGSPVQLDGTYTGAVLNNFTAANGRLTYTGPVALPVSIVGQATLEGTGDVALSIRVGSSSGDPGESTLGLDPAQHHALHMVTLQPGSWIELWIQSTGSPTVTISRATLQVFG